MATSVSAPPAVYRAELAEDGELKEREARELRRARRTRRLLVRWLRRVERRELDARRWTRLRQRRARRVLLLHRHGELGVSLSPAARTLLLRMLGEPAPPAAALEPPEVDATEHEAEDVEEPEEAAEVPSGFFDSPEAAQLAGEMTTRYQLGGIVAEARSQWTHDELLALQAALTAVSSTVRSLAVASTTFTRRPGMSDLAAEARLIGDEVVIDVYDLYSDFSADQKRESVIHELGHVIHWRRPAIFTSFRRHLGANPISREQARAIGGRVFGQYMIETWNPREPIELFAQVYAAWVVERSRLPRTVRTWAQRNFP